MATKTLVTKIALRRDNDYNYESKKDTYIPLRGEVCFVDTAKNGLRAKVGDGVNVWKDLPYTDDVLYSAIDNIIQHGYYHEGNFYSDSTHTELLATSDETIYIDRARSKIYIYNNGYVCINETLPVASAEQAGILKLYDTTGENTDGAVTQRLFTTELNKKVEASVNSADEILILSTN